MLSELVRKCRSIRRFHGDRKIEPETLVKLVDLARLSSSAGNVQPLKHIISVDDERNAIIFKHLRWAGYLKDWPGPNPEDRPTGYIIILGDNKIKENVKWDHGIASQVIMLAAAEKGLGGCIFASVDRDALRADMKIPERYDILLAVAIGYPKEKVVLEEIGADGSIEYYRDADGVHHVPKRKLEDIIVDV